MVATLEQPEAPAAIRPPAQPTPTPGNVGGNGAVMTPRFRIGRDALNEAIDGLPAERREMIEWFWRYCLDHNVDREQLGRMLTTSGGEFYSADSVYQLLTGRRMKQGANIAPMLRAIELKRREVDPVRKSEGFVETLLFRKIKRYIERAMKLGRCGFIFGDFSIGKSETLIELSKRNAAWLYTRMPTRGHLNHYLQECARKLGMGDRQTVADLRERVIDALPDVLIVDEADQCFQSFRNVLGLATMDFLREAYDRRKIAIIFVMDHFGRDSLLNGQHKMRMKRLWRRRIPRLQLPAVPYPSDLDAFAASVGLPPAPDATVRVKITVEDEETGEGKEISHTDNPRTLQKETVAGEDGLGIWLMLLHEAQDMAREAKRPITWGAVLKAHAEYVAAEEADDQ